MTVADLYAKLSLRTNKASFDAGERLIGTIKKAAVALGAYMSIKWAAGLIEQTTEAASRIVDLSSQVGLAIEPLQQLGFAASQSGSSMDGLAVGMKRFALNAQAARDGGDEQRKMFRKLGVDTKALLDGTLPLDKAVEQVADKFAKMPDGPQKTALAMKAFGKSGAELIPMLNEGGAGIARMRQEFIDLGGQIDEDTARKLEGFGDDVDKVKIVFAGLRNTLVRSVLPALLDLVKTFIAWYKLHREEITRKLERAMNQLVFVLRAVGRAVLWVLETTDNLKGGFELLMVSVAALGLAMLAPFALTAAALAGIILLVQDVWTWFKYGASHSVLGGLYEYMVDGLSETIEKWISKIKGFFAWAKEKKDAFLGQNQTKLLFDNSAVTQIIGKRAVGNTAVERARASAAGEKAAGEKYGEGKVGWIPPIYGLNQLAKWNFRRNDNYTIPSSLVDQAKRSVQIQNMPINVTVPPAMSTKEGASFIGQAVRDALESATRDLAAGTRAE
jgi:hypothetical protein